MKKYLFLTFFLPSLFTLSCGGGSTSGGDEETATREETTQPSADALDRIKEMSEKAAEGQPVEVVDFRELKALLPERLAGMERTTHEGQRTGAFGMNVATAQAEYRDGSTRLDVVITDTGGFVAAAVGLAAWASVDFDRETEDGYERTTTIEGYKAFESYNNKEKRGELSVLVGDRFVVALKGEQIGEKTFREAIKKLDLGKLADL